MRILFIGNSHTYFNDMPQIVADICEKNGVPTEVTMLAHGGMGLDFHAKQPEVRFNLLYGCYDYVILQHVAHPFGNEELMFSAARELFSLIQDTSTQPLFYMTWSEQKNPQGQERMSKAYVTLGKELGIPVAPVGCVWQSFRADHPEVELYDSDGEHASLAGSTLAAYVLAETVLKKPPLPRRHEEMLFSEAAAQVQ